MPARARAVQWPPAFQVSPVARVICYLPMVEPMDFFRKSLPLSCLPCTQLFGPPFLSSPPPPTGGADGGGGLLPQARAVQGLRLAHPAWRAALRPTRHWKDPAGAVSVCEHSDRCLEQLQRSRAGWVCAALLPARRRRDAAGAAEWLLGRWGLPCPLFGSATQCNTVCASSRSARPL